MSSMSPITTLFPAACAAVAVIDANNSHGIVRSPIDFFIWGAFLVFWFCEGGKLGTCRAGSIRLSSLMRTQGSPGDVCGGLRDPAQLVLIVREQRMFFGKPENRLSLLRIVTLGLILAGRKPAIPSP